MLFHPRHILFVLRRAWLRSRTLHSRRSVLLPLFAYCRGSLLGSRLWRLRWFADVFTTLVLLGAWGRRCDLLVRRWPFEILLLLSSHRWCFLYPSLSWFLYSSFSRHWFSTCRWWRLLLNDLADDLVTRLVTVALAAQFMLLLDPGGIPVS